MIGILFVPVKAAVGAGKLTAKGGFGTGKMSAVSAYRITRWVGVRRILTAGAGVGVGLLIAPMSGQELRDKLRQQWQSRRAPASDDAVAERVRYELSHSPRTWHLPQPEVEVVGGKAILTGGAPHPTGKTDIERTVASVPGVGEVDSQLVVSGNGQ
ncbi:MAG TPA: BON domain-containing protein [Acidimicrobiales bacterium]|jgi:hypothetical protein|nr:BON domain-containing protein [Acidimicrobiales bacterium]